MHIVLPEYLENEMQKICFFKYKFFFNVITQNCYLKSIILDTSENADQ